MDDCSSSGLLATCENICMSYIKPLRESDGFSHSAVQAEPLTCLFSTNCSHRLLELQFGREPN